MQALFEQPVFKISITHAPTSCFKVLKLSVLPLTLHGEYVVVQKAETLNNVHLYV